MKLKAFPEEGLRGLRVREVDILSEKSEKLHWIVYFQHVEDHEVICVVILGEKVPMVLDVEKQDPDLHNDSWLYPLKLSQKSHCIL